MMCTTPTITEDEIKAGFVKAFNAYLGNRDEVIRNIEAARKLLCSTKELEEEKEKQADEMNVVSELLHKALEENARVAQDQEEYERKYAALEERYNKAEAAFNEAVDRIQQQGARNRQLCQMIRQLKKLDGPLEEFDAGLWGVFVDRVTVQRNGNMVVKFKDVTDIRV